jgi:hypothetical protein
MTRQQVLKTALWVMLGCAVLLWLLNLSDLDTTTGKVSFVVWLVCVGACVWQLRQIARESEQLEPEREPRD